MENELKIGSHFLLFEAGSNQCWRSAGRTSGDGEICSTMSLTMNHPNYRVIIQLSLALVALLPLNVFGGEFSVASIFSDGMVLQRDEPLPVWGRADSGATVAVEFNGQKKSATAGADGRWQVKLDAMQALNTGGKMVVVCGDESKNINDVVVGEVWFCSGQSNMDLPLAWLGGKASEERFQPIADYIDREIKTTEDSLFRQFAVKHGHSPLEELDTTKGQWISSTPATNGSFTGPGYFFGKELRKQLKVPVGLIKCAYGGTSIEPWIPKSGFMRYGKLNAKFDSQIERMKQAIDAWDQAKVDREHAEKVKKWEEGGKKGHRPGKPGPPQNNPQFVTTLFNAMVHPVIPYRIKGVIWYQGETNAMVNGDEYAVLFETLVNSWRESWGKADMPFYMAQLANWKGFRDWVKVCDAQRRAIGRVDNTGMAVLYDIGEETDIHPKNKIDVGKRLALWALKNDYKLDVPACSGPLYKTHEVRGDHIMVTFNHAGSGLMVGRKELLNEAKEVNEPLKHFEVAGVGADWQPARAEIASNNSVKVWSEDVPRPNKVRYAWKPNPEGLNLYNKEGLPASLFTSEPNFVDLELRSETRQAFFANLKKVYQIDAVEGTTVKPENLGKNIALNAAVEASSVLENQVAKHAVDDDLNTGWTPTKEDGETAWVKIDLGTTYRITHIGYRSRPVVWNWVNRFKLTFPDGTQQICFLDETKQDEFQYFDIEDVESATTRWSVFKTRFGQSGAMEIAVYGVSVK